MIFFLSFNKMHGGSSQVSLEREGLWRVYKSLDLQLPWLYTVIRRQQACGIVSDFPNDSYSYNIETDRNMSLHFNFLPRLVIGFRHIRVAGRTPGHRPLGSASFGKLRYPSMEDSKWLGCPVTYTYGQRPTPRAHCSAPSGKHRVIAHGL